MTEPSPRRAVAVVACLVFAAVAIGVAWLLHENTALPPPRNPAGAVATIDAPPKPAPTPQPAPVERAAVAPEPAPAAVAADTTPAAEAAKHEVRGRVVDARGAGIDGADVWADPPSSDPTHVQIGGKPGAHAVTTDAQGAFVLPLAFDGTATLHATHDEHPPTAQVCKLDRARIDGIVLVLADGGVIRGRITGAPADRGRLVVVARKAAAAERAAGPRLPMFDVDALLAGLDLPVGDRTTEPDAEGHFALAGLAHDTRYRVFAVRAPNGGRCTSSAEATTAAEAELRWLPSATLLLRVVDRDTGQALESLDVAAGPVQRLSMLGASVNAPMRSDLPQHTFPDGRVEIADLPIEGEHGATFSVRVQAKGRVPWSRDDLRLDRAGRIDLGTIPLATAPIVRVTVTADGAPVAGALVELAAIEAATAGEPSDNGVQITTSTSVHESIDRTPETAAQRTDAQGRIELTTTLHGKARVVVTAKGFARTRGEPFDVPERGTVEQALVLQRGGTIVVKVLDGRRQPLPGARVQNRGPNDDDVEQTADAQGIVRFADCEPGEHTLATVRRDARTGGVQVTIGGTDNPASRRIAVRARETVEVELVEPLRGTLTGVVTLDGEPLDHATVQVESLGSDGRGTDGGSAAIASLLGGMFGAATPNVARTDDDGAFRLREVIVGPSRLRVSHRRLAMPATVDTVVGEGDNRCDCTIRATVVRGRVLDAAGAPLAGATVGVAPDADRASVAAAELGTLLGAPTAGVRSDDTGAFELRGVQPGVPLRIAASARLHVAGSVRLAPLAEGATKDGLELRLGAAGRVRVRVTAAPEGELTASWAGAAEAAPAKAFLQAKLAAGRATLDGLAPGRWRIVLGGGGPSAPPERTVDVTAGATLDVEF